MMNDGISARLARSLEIMEQRLNRDINDDMHCRFFRVYRREAAVYFVDGMVSADFLQHYLLTPCLAHAGDALPGEEAASLEALSPLLDTARADTYQDAIRKMMNGHAVVMMDGLPCAVCFDVRAYVRRSVSQPLTESVVSGPHQGFNESIRDNITLIRRILPTPQLISEMRVIGEGCPVSLCLMYLRDAVDPASLDRLKSRLDSLHVDHVLSIGALEQLLEDSPWALLPQCCLTERPDRAASFLREGQMVLVLDGAPQILCMPVSILHLIHTPDDTSLRWQYGTFLRLIRLLGAAVTLLLPGLFVAAVIFHPELLPVTLLTAILESQAAVPLSIPMEMLLMLLMFNLIGEAATRVPGVVGSSLGTVSGLILGQAAVEAKLVHPLLIIVVAVASLGSYAVPDYSLGLACRIAQLLFLAVASVFGLYGMVLCLGATAIRLCGMRSLGSPFAAPLSPDRTHNPDVFLRAPLWRQRLRAWLANPRRMERITGPMRGFDRRRK